MRGGYPLNWRVYMAGLEFLQRNNAREDLRRFRVVNNGVVGGSTVAGWVREKTVLAGW